MTEKWHRKRWGEICELRYGKAVPKSCQCESHTVPVYGTSGIFGYTCDSLADGPKPIVGRKGTLGVQLAQGPFWTVDTAFWLQAGPDLDPIWAYYRLSIINFKGEDSGSAVPSLTRDHFYSMSIDLPPLEEQRRVAKVLGALDDLIETNQRLMASLDGLGMALFLDIWDGKSMCPLESLGSVVMGQSPPGSTYNEDRQGLVFYQGVRDFGERYPSPRVFCTAPTRKAKPGDILIAVRAPIGDTNVATEPTAIGRGLASLSANQPAIALRALRATETTWNAYKGTGTVFSSISGPDLRKAPVPAVTDAQVERTLQALDAQYAACAAEVAQLRLTRDELLPLLLSGRVTVREGAA
jgi:hypothetical protein